MNSMKQIAKNARLLVLGAGLLCGTTLHGAEKIKILLIDGQNNHKWKQTTPVLVEALEGCGQFDVEVSTTPPKKAPQSAWKSWNPDFSAFDAVLSNYNGKPWPEKVQKDFEAFVKNGGGFVVVHAADNSFPEWLEYNKMIGVGGWGERVVGPKTPWVYVEGGKVVRVTEPAQEAGTHGKREPYVVENIVADHPITKGLPAKWMHTRDEMYSRLCGPAENMTILATGFSTITKHNEPLLMVIDYGKGRVFHTVLGHDEEAMRCRGFYTTLQRGTEWAATGKVVRTAKVPDDFPTAKTISAVPKP
jgi:type 1 glutamine amidotransferase